MPNLNSNHQYMIINESPVGLMREILPRDTRFVHFVHETQTIGDRVMELNVVDEEHLPPINFFGTNANIYRQNYYWNNRQQILARHHADRLAAPPVSSADSLITRNRRLESRIRNATNTKQNIRETFIFPQVNGTHVGTPAYFDGYYFIQTFIDNIQYVKHRHTYFPDGVSPVGPFGRRQ